MKTPNAEAPGDTEELMGIGRIIEPDMIILKYFLCVPRVLCVRF